MRAAMVALIGMLTAQPVMIAEAQARPEEFSVAGFILNLNIPNYMVANRDR